MPENYLGRTVGIEVKFQILSDNFTVVMRSLYEDLQRKTYQIAETLSLILTINPLLRLFNRR